MRKKGTVCPSVIDMCDRAEKCIRIIRATQD